MQEANLSATEPVNIDSPEGFLYEWWSLFWDIYNARNSKPSSNEARLYTEVCVSPSITNIYTIIIYICIFFFI